MSGGGVIPACRSCGVKLEPDDARGQESGLCLACSTKAAEGRAGLEDAAPVEIETAPEDRRKLTVRSALAAASVLLAAAAISWPTLPGQAVLPEPPDRTGRAETDVVADQCLENLTLLEEIAASGDFQTLLDEAVCPATGEPYSISWLEDDPTADGFLGASCPTPEAHGLGGLTIDAGDEMPTVQE